MHKQTYTQNRWQFFKPHTEEQSLSLPKNIDKVIEAIINEGSREFYFESESAAEDFKQELSYVIATGRVVFHASILSDFGNYPAAQSKQDIQADTTRKLSVKDSLMKAVISSIDGNRSQEVVEANQIFSRIITETCSPGPEGIWIEFTDNINRCHPTPGAGSIIAKHPLEGQIYLPDCAYNAADINLLKYIQNDGRFEVAAFQHTVDLLSTALDIVIGLRSYGTEESAKTTLRHRPLAIGYMNLAGSIMTQGLGYDSHEARAQAAAITALMTGQAFLTSAKLARSLGTFAAFHQDRTSILSIVQKHYDEIARLDARLVAEELHSAAAGVWAEVLMLSKIDGLRNSQVTALGSVQIKAGETNNLEPIDYARFAANTEHYADTMGRALKVLGYNVSQITAIIKYLDVNDTMEGAPYLKEMYFPVLPYFNSNHNTIYNAQLKMMIALQPFLSGGIGCPIKVNGSVDLKTTHDLYIKAWEGGLKTLFFKISKPGDYHKQQILQPITSETPQLIKQNNKFSTTKPNHKNIGSFDIRKSTTLTLNSKHGKGRIVICEDDNGIPVEVVVKLFHEDIEQIKLADDIVALINIGLKRGVTLEEYIKIQPASQKLSESVNKNTTLVQDIIYSLRNYCFNSQDKVNRSNENY